MSDSTQSSDNNPVGLIGSAIRGFKIGSLGVGLYLLYRFIRPYWYALRIRDWLQVERDYIKDFNRSLHPLGLYKFEVHLTDSEGPDLIIENRSRRVPVILRANLGFEPGTLSTLLERKTTEEDIAMGDDHTLFLEEVEWALSMAPGVSSFVDTSGVPCTPMDADGVQIEYRIYPDAVSQHEILNSIVEIANAFKIIRQREANFADRLNGNR